MNKKTKNAVDEFIYKVALPVYFILIFFLVLVLFEVAINNYKNASKQKVLPISSYNTIKCEFVSESARLENLVAARKNLLAKTEQKDLEISSLKEELEEYKAFKDNIEKLADDSISGFTDEPVRSTYSFDHITVSDEFVYYTHYFDERSNKYHNVKMEEPIQKYVFSCCKKHDVPYEIIMGIMGVETGWKHEIGYRGKYYGIGMINVELAKDYLAGFGINLTTPEGGIEGTCAIFAKKLAAFDGDIPMAILAYNRGNGGARSYINTNNVMDATYVKRVYMIANSLTVLYE